MHEQSIHVLGNRRIWFRASSSASNRSGAGCMSWISIVLLGLAMSTDAFAAALGKGAGMLKPRLVDALRAGLIFGVVETITPVIGWLLGSAASNYVEAWDHWIAFVLLGSLGAHMLWKAWKSDGAGPADVPGATGILALAVAGLATSIDAMAVGVGLAFVDTPIWLIAAVIGVCTFVMVTLGVMLGRVLGSFVGSWAEALGGVILISVGTGILFQHLNA